MSDDIHIDPETARLIGQVLSGVAVGVGLAPGLAALATPTVLLAQRLTDAGYSAPDVAALRDKRDQVASLPDLGGGA